VLPTNSAGFCLQLARGRRGPAKSLNRGYGSQGERVGPWEVFVILVVGYRTKEGQGFAWLLGWGARVG